MKYLIIIIIMFLYKELVQDYLNQNKTIAIIFTGKYKLLKKKYMNMKIKKIKEKEKEKKNKSYNENISIDGILNNMEQNSLFEEDNDNINKDNDSIFSSIGSKSLMYGQFNMNTEYNL